MKEQRREILFWNTNGLTIIESLVALAITSTVILGLMQVLDISNSLQKRVEKLHSLSALKKDLTFNLGNNYLCTETILTATGDTEFDLSTQSLELEKVVGADDSRTFSLGANPTYPDLEITKMTIIPSRLANDGMWATLRVNANQIVNSDGSAQARAGGSFDIPLFILFTSTNLKFKSCFAANTDVAASYFTCKDHFHGEWTNDGVNIPFCKNFLYNRAEDAGYNPSQEVELADLERSNADYGDRVQELLVILNKETEATYNRAKLDRDTVIKSNTEAIDSLKNSTKANAELAQQIETSILFYGKQYLHSRGR